MPAAATLPAVHGKVVSKEIAAGALDVKGVDQTIYDRINAKYGTSFRQREK